MGSEVGGWYWWLRVFASVLPVAAVTGIVVGAVYRAMNG